MHDNCTPMTPILAPIPRIDPIEEASNRIREAIRLAHGVDIHLRAYDCTDDYDLPNAGTVIVAELSLALECLTDASRCKVGSGTITMTQTRCPRCGQYRDMDGLIVCRACQATR